MKRSTLVRYLQAHGCRLIREGGSHSIWINPALASSVAIPRHTEIKDILARAICRSLSVPEIGRKKQSW